MQFFHCFGGKGYSNNLVGERTHFSTPISPGWVSMRMSAEIIDMEISFIEWDEVVNCQLVMLCACRASRLFGIFNYLKVSVLHKMAWLFS